MSTLEENVTKVENAFTAIKAAVVAKGGTSPSSLSNVASAIEGIPVGQSTTNFTITGSQSGTVKESENGYTLAGRYKGTGLVSIIVTEPSKPEPDTDASSMFEGCTSLRSITSSTFPYSFGQDVSDVSSMFAGCTSLRTVEFVDYSLFGATGANAADMFNGCTSLKYVIMPSFFDSSQGCASTVCMFSGCSALEYVQWPTCPWGEGITDATDMFKGCSKLEYFYNSFPSLGCSFSLADCTALSAAEMVKAFKALQHAPGMNITMTSAQLGMLSSEAQNIATSKGWNFTTV